MADFNVTYQDMKDFAIFLTNESQEFQRLAVSLREIVGNMAWAGSDQKEFAGKIETLISSLLKVSSKLGKDSAVILQQSRAYSEAENSSRSKASSLGC